MNFVFLRQIDVTCALNAVNALPFDIFLKIFLEGLFLRLLRQIDVTCAIAFRFCNFS